MPRIVGKDGKLPVGQFQKLSALVSQMEFYLGIKFYCCLICSDLFYLCDDGFVNNTGERQWQLQLLYV